MESVPNESGVVVELGDQRFVPPTIEEFYFESVEADIPSHDRYPEAIGGKLLDALLGFKTEWKKAGLYPSHEDSSRRPPSSIQKIPATRWRRAWPEQFVL